MPIVQALARQYDVAISVDVFTTNATSVGRLRRAPL
jgi:hypothetical protein